MLVFRGVNCLGDFCPAIAMFVFPGGGGSSVFLFFFVRGYLC